MTFYNFYVPQISCGFKSNWYITFAKLSFVLDLKFYLCAIDFVFPLRSWTLTTQSPDSKPWPKSPGRLDQVESREWVADRLEFF